MARANNHGEVLNLSGIPTPDVSYHPEPDIDRANAISSLLRDAKQQRTGALKLLVRDVLFYRTILVSTIMQVQLRDIPKCPITDLELSLPDDRRLGLVKQTATDPELAHIIPFSLNSKVRRAYSSFSNGVYGISLRPKLMWPSRRSRAALSWQKILLRLLIPPKMLYFCNMTPIWSMISDLLGASRL